MNLFIIRNYKYIEKYLFLFFFLISITNFFYLNVSIIIYLIFIFTSFLLLKMSLNLDNSFGIIFLSCLVLLGFWFKFSFVSIFFNSNFGEGIGYFNFSRKQYDELLLVCTIFQTSLIIANTAFLKLKIPSYRLNLKSIENACLKNFNSLVIIFLAIIFFICYINFSNEIFLRTKNYNKDYIFLSNFFKFFFRVLGPFMLYFIVDLSLGPNISLKKKIVVILLAALAINVIYFSQLSREAALHLLLIFFIFLLNYENLKNLKNINFLRNYFFIIFALFCVVNIFLVQYLRVTNTNSDSEKISTFKKINNNNVALLFNRWVGIDATMAVVSSEKKGWSLTKNIYKNQINWTQEIAWPNTDYFLNRVHVNIPGPAAFFYSAGSYIFLFFSCFIFFILFFFLEYLIKTISKNFVISTFFLIFILAYRFIHFGLGGINFILFILSILLIIFTLVSINFILKHK